MTGHRSFSRGTDHVHRSVEDFPFLSQIAVVEYDGFFLRIFAAVQDVRECPVDFIVFAGFDFYRQDSAGQLYDEVQFTALLVVVVVRSQTVGGKLLCNSILVDGAVIDVPVACDDAQLDSICVLCG